MKSYLEKLSGRISFQNGILIYSMFDGHLKRPSFRSFMDCLEKKGLKRYTVHTSGHADAQAIDQLIHQVRPELLIPVHTEQADWFRRYEQMCRVILSVPAEGVDTVSTVRIASWHIILSAQSIRRISILPRNENRKSNGTERRLWMNIVFPDADSVGKDIDLSAFAEYGNLQTYAYLTEEEMAEKTVDADVLIVNKLPVNERTIGKAEHLKLVCVSATGTNNLDKAYLDDRGIAWRNVAGYSTDVVSQHTFALLFYVYEKLRYYDDYVKSGMYAADRMFTHFGQTFRELSGKTWGIIGLGTIGRKVASIASAFGCRIICYSASGSTYETEYEQVDWEGLLAESDIISIHAPLTAATEGLMNAEAFSKMKPEAVLINVARGQIVVEQDLADALEAGEIAGAGLDVLCEEPADPDNPLLAIKDSNRLIITPHIAWASVEARNRVMQIIHRQIGEFFAPHPGTVR